MTGDDGWGGIGDEYQQRTGSDETSGTGETNEMSDTTATPATTEPNGTNGTNETSETTETNIKEEWNGRTVYLPDEIVDDADIRFDELALEAKRADEEIKKNRDFYPAVFRAALNETSIEVELGLE